MRNPLDKETFMGGNRQKWFSILLVFLAGILFIDAKCDINPEPYLSFLTITGSVFILGGSVDSALKITKAKPKE